MFSRLRTKLTVLYAGLFGASLMLVAMAVYIAVSSNAERAVRSELEASSTVFDRIWALRSQQLQEGAALLSRDFGFREAVATNDAPTIRSALANLKTRFDADIAYTVGLDGSVVASDGRGEGGGVAQVIRSLDNDETATGVFVADGVPYEAISAPIMSPTLMGWVVFATRLDDKEMNSLEKLSAIPIDATVVARAKDGRWRTQKDFSGVNGVAVSRFVDRELARHNGRAREMMMSSGRTIALAKPLQSLSGGAPVALLLRYPVARALEPYRLLLATIGATGILGFILLVIGSWMLARRITRPITALDEAAQRLQRGEYAEVAVAGGDDEITRLAASFNTMSTEIRERERRITHLAMHDRETDLPNRVALEQQIEQTPPPGAGVIVAVALGVDRFTQVRGAIGYGLAGALIGEIGRKLSLLNPDCRLARMTTDVVAMVFEAADLDEAKARTARCVAALEAPLTLGDNTIDISLTAGVAVFNRHNELVGSLLERANIALDQARAGRVKIAVFDPAIYGDPSSTLSLMSEMLRGIGENQLVLHHQPKLDIRKRAVTGVEALVRWRHPSRGMLAPDHFIPMAEETGHIGALTEWVLARALEEQAILRHHGHDLAMSINLSGRLLGDHDFADTALDMTRGAAGDICFEVTETAVIEKPDVALEIIDRFAEAGIGISIDDYGSGLSSLSYLKQIRADELKIDKAFIFGMGESQRDALLVRSTIDLAHSLGLKVTAEGVETPLSLSLLAGMGCDLAQGYLIARPAPLKDLMEFLKDEQENHARYG